jgi:hypothetical protein
MKSCHPAALALVGWYLMVPPTKDANDIDPSVPLPKWVVLRAFDTAAAFDDAQDQLRCRVSPVGSTNSSLGRIAESGREHSGNAIL